jgi:hypothetical protein
VVWRKKDANPELTQAEGIVREILGEPEKGDQVTCGPGPFSMASPDLVSDQLVAAGYDHITFERHDAEMMVGATIERAIDFALALGPAGEIVRLGGAGGGTARRTHPSASHDVGTVPASERSVDAVFDVDCHGACRLSLCATRPCA